MIQHIESQGKLNLDIESINIELDKFSFVAFVRFKDESDIRYMYEKNERRKIIWQSGYIVDDAKKMNEKDLKHYERNDNK